MATTLGFIPFLMVGGWLIVAAIPLFAVLIGLQVVRRAGNYSITRPGREMLFTLVDAETRYKAKPVIDIVVYRGGDMVTAWLHTALRESMNFGLAGVAVFAAGIAVVWTMSGVFLGRKYNDANDEQTAASAENSA
jgi:AAA family ATP:ADP antiporter